MKTFILATLLSLLPTSEALGQSYISKLYCQVFGNDDLKPEYRELVYQVLADYGVTDPQSVPVKKMNHVGSALVGMQLSSFTACGIWFDEEYLDSCSEREMIFQICHEAAHYAKRHHQKLIASHIALGAAYALSLASVYNFMKKHENLHADATIIGAGILGGLALFAGITPYLVKCQEKDADIKAAEYLIALDCHEIVEQRIQDVRSSETDGTIWWFSHAEQVSYLEDVLHSRIS